MVWKNRGWLHLIPRAGDDISGFWKSKTENPQDCVFLPLLNLSQSMQRDDHRFAAFIFFENYYPWKLPLVYNFNQRHFCYNLIEESNAGVGTGPGPCPGKFSVPGNESRNSLVPGTVPQSWVPESLVSQIWVPVPVPDPGWNFEIGSNEILRSDQFWWL